MIFFQSNFKFNYKKTLKLTFVGTTCLLLLMPFAKAKAQLKGAALPSTTNNSIQPSQQQVCPSDKLLPIRRFDSAKYYVYICKGYQSNSPGYYVRITKNSGSKITVPITNTFDETYVAAKGEVTYVVTPYELVVNKQTKDGIIIFRERVNNAIAANGESLARGCPNGNTTFVEAETKSFIVYICGKDFPSNYVAIVKNSNHKITIPLQSYNPRGAIKNSQYVAINGDIRYLLTQKLLKVSRDGRTIVKEKILHWN